MEVGKNTQLLELFFDYAKHSGRPLKSILRVKLNGRNIFLSQAKRMTMEEVGVKEGDVFYLSSSLPSSDDPPKESNNGALKAKSAKGKRTSTKQGSKQRSQWAGVTECTSSKEYHMKLHSIKMR
jgi:hypothetical protein